MPEKALTFSEVAILLVLMAEADEISNPELKERYGVTLTGDARKKLNDLKWVESRKQGRAYAHMLTDTGWAHIAGMEVQAVIGKPNVGGTAVAAVRALVAGLQRFLDRTDQRYSDIFTPQDDTEPSNASQNDSGLTPAADDDAALMALNGTSPASHNDSSTTSADCLTPSSGQAAPAPSTPKEVPSPVSPTRAAPGSETDLMTRIRATYAELAKEPGAWVSLTRLRPLLSDVPREDLDEALRRMNRMPGVNIVPASDQKALTWQDRDAAVIIGDQDKHFLWIGAR
ncbi:hypothetical protein [Microtetraspora sp. NBRC 16547]|uniref:hypothetical protein n=1 Tax=Microtetraspora sp. NBRC 16547 TaxID=3030993 RepID=UPI0024A3D5EA|nr:hypothetical protein [Microtetraspora sp. NBRC 16547]GLX00617.1 hypothetical protein Misp02_47030 [Microtetraspora sp. NBRC 16547]